ncbi:protein kinase [candidate division KSB1 bacterium]|nr:protein kinase [candidate division KSB1 bacterium]
MPGKEMIGQTISHYKILEKLGGGGMGVVYKAEDSKLKRLVALKFLPPELTRDEEAKARFAQEAQTASALDHPNICTIYEIDEIPITLSFPSVEEVGQLYIAMAYYDGETLKAQVARGKLQVARIIDIATQMAQGLAKAHQHGIVHRDIKSANVMVTSEGVVKIIDFGLSKLAGTKSLTKPGTTLGTPAYMSPEQMSQVEADHRTDIWSLGVVMYEMVTGQLLFREENELALVYAIVNEKPAPITALRPDMPIELERIVDKTMQKDRRKRYQRMEEIIGDLHQLKGASPSQKVLTPLHEPQPNKLKKSPSDRKTQRMKNKFYPLGFIYPLVKFKPKPRVLALSGFVLFAAIAALLGYFFWQQPPEKIVERIPVAVADFVNETKEDELDGLSGMLITALEQSRRLSVLTRSRMFDVLKQMGKGNVDRIDEMLGREICQRANVKTLVVASIRKFGKLYSIDLKIIDLEKNEHLFVTNETGEGQESIPAMIDKLSEETRAGFKERATEIRATSRKVAEVTTINLEAYRHYFLGEQFIHELKFKEAEKELKKAVALDTTFGLAYYQLSYVNRWRYHAEGLDESENVQNLMLQKAATLLNRIPPKERDLVRAQRVLLEQGGYAGDVGAVEILREMERSYPDEKEMLYLIGDLSYHLSRHSVAAEYLEKVLKMDPSHGRALQHLVRTYSDMGNYEKMFAVAQQFRLVNEIEGNYYLGEYYYHIGDYKLALERMEKFLAVTSKGWTYSRAVEYLARTYGKSGQCEKVFEYVRRLDYKKSVILYLPGLCFIRQNNQDHIEKYLLEAKKRYADNLSFWTLLLFSYPYRGKYRQGLEFFDEFIAMNWQAKDTANVTNVQMYKAFYYVWGWNDFAKARVELEKTLRYSAYIPYWTKVTMLYIYRGDYAAAESLIVQKKDDPQFLRLLIHSHRHEWAEAQAIAQSLLPALPKQMRAWALYPLAKCQFEVGHYEAALATLLQIQKPFDHLEDFVDAVYYPKSFYLMGKIYEQKGDEKLAIQNYEKLLQLWKEADPDLPELIDTKARLAALRRA